MKNIKFNLIQKSVLFGLIVLIGFSCERTLSDDAVDAKYPNTAEIFTDDVVGMGTAFYFPYGGSKLTAWTVDRTQGFNSTASMRFDVPNANDAEGNYAGAIFRTEGAGRDLTGFNALTFYVKANRGVSIDEFGFGEDFFPNKYIATITNVSVGTNWQKVIIPIPDASKLIKERGMFRYAAGTQATGGSGYVFWIDDLKFEKLGTISPGVASIMNGINVNETTFNGVNSSIQNAKVTFNMPNGINQAVKVAPAYLEFKSSNPAVATVDASGNVISVSAGTAIITANFIGKIATGSLTITCIGSFVSAPTPPTRNPANVISIFSNAYANVPVNYYNGYWAPWQTTVSNDFTVQGDNILSYSIFNFVGIEFSSPVVNASTMTHIHLDAFIPAAIAPGRQLRIIVVDFGANGAFGGGDDTRHSTTFTAPFLVSQSWMGIDIPFAAMPGLLSKSNLAQIILEGGDGSVIRMDNIYFYN